MHIFRSFLQLDLFFNASPALSLKDNPFPISSQKVINRQPCPAAG
jgi:hypothetical protein